MRETQKTKKAFTSNEHMRLPAITDHKHSYDKSRNAWERGGFKTLSFDRKLNSILTFWESGRAMGDVNVNNGILLTGKWVCQERRKEKTG